MNDELNLWIELRKGSQLDSDRHIKTIEAAFNAQRKPLILENANLINEIHELKQVITTLKKYLYKSLTCPGCGVAVEAQHHEGCQLLPLLSRKTWRYRP